MLKQRRRGKEKNQPLRKLFGASGLSHSPFPQHNGLNVSGTPASWLHLAGVSCGTSSAASPAPASPPSPATLLLCTPTSPGASACMLSAESLTMTWHTSKLPTRAVLFAFLVSFWFHRRGDIHERRALDGPRDRDSTGRERHRGTSVLPGASREGKERGEKGEKHHFPRSINPIFR